MRKLKKSALPADPGDEIALLIRRLQRTEQRLQALTGGELDSVLLGGGHSFLLQQAQEKLRSSEAVQSCILNALPAHIALLDDQGVILSVNDGWRHSAARGRTIWPSANGRRVIALRKRAPPPPASGRSCPARQSNSPLSIPAIHPPSSPGSG
jgi:PAS domain-containing protein